MMKKLLLIILVCVVLTIAIFFLLFGLKECITIRDESTHKLLYVKQIKPDMMIEFSYIHSVSLTPIIEELFVTSEGFILDRVLYIDQGGAGMPEFAWGEQEFIIEDDKFIIQGFDRFFESIVINVQRVYENEIDVDGEEINLFQLLGSNGKVILDVENRLVYKY